MTQGGGAWQVEKVAGHVQAYNTVTGEVALLATGKARRRQPKHLLLVQETLRQLAQEGTLGKVGWRVLGYVMGMLEWENWLVVAQGGIAEALHLRQQQVSLALGQLVARRILLKAAPPAPRSTYRFNPMLGYRGGYEGWAKFRRTHGTDITNGTIPDPAPGPVPSPRQSRPRREER